jgi:hypothetical protein
MEAGLSRMSSVPAKASPTPLSAPSGAPAQRRPSEAGPSSGSFAVSTARKDLVHPESRPSSPALHILRETVLRTPARRKRRPDPPVDRHPHRTCSRRRPPGHLCDLVHEGDARPASRSRRTGGSADAMSITRADSRCGSTARVPPSLPASTLSANRPIGFRRNHPPPTASGTRVGGHRER